jgi:hypothetical protein
LLVWAQQPILSRNPPNEVGKRHATRLANQPTSLEPFLPPLAVARGGEVPGRANHVTHPSPLGVPSHPADVQIVEATASRSFILPRVHTVLGITCIEHPSMSTGEELPGHCLGTTSSHDHTLVCSIKQLSMIRVPHSPYMSTGRECQDAVCSRTPSLDHTSVVRAPSHTSVCMRRGPNNGETGQAQKYGTVHMLTHAVFRRLYPGKLARETWLLTPRLVLALSAN